MSDALCGLSLSDLEVLCAAVRSGRLCAPFSTAAVGRYCPSELAESVAEELRQFAAEGVPTAGVARLLDTLAADRRSQRDPDDLLDLVLSGPEAPGTPTRDTAVVVRELFSSATKSVLLVGYAVHQGKHVFRALAERMEAVPDLAVRMFLDVRREYGDTRPELEVLREFARRFQQDEWPGTRMPEIYYDPRSLALDPKQRASLHAKCVVVDRTVAFISSANFTEAAQERNVEVGIVIRSPAVSRKLHAHFAQLVEKGALCPLWRVSERLPSVA